MERKQQLERSLAATIVNGNFCNERSVVKTWLRNWYLWILQLIPSWKHHLELGQRQAGLTRYTWAPGMPFLSAYDGGKCIPQVFCIPYTSTATKPLFTDDVIFNRDKKALFQLVVLLGDAQQLSGAIEHLTDLEKMGEGELNVNEATFIIEDVLPAVDQRTIPKCALGRTYRIVQRDEYDSNIWGSLPEPIGYDGRRMRREVHGKYVIVRPDRFVFAACNSARELIEASGSLAAMFHSNGKV
jgi:hypothetical protein